MAEEEEEEARGPPTTSVPRLALSWAFNLSAEAGPFFGGLCVGVYGTFPGLKFAPVLDVRLKV